MKKRFGHTLVTGSNRRIQIRYATPSWSKEELPYFVYQRTRHYLSNFERINSVVLTGFDGAASDSLWTGTLVKLVYYEGEEYVRAYSYRVLGDLSPEMELPDSAPPPLTSVLAKGQDACLISRMGHEGG